MISSGSLDREHVASLVSVDALSGRSDDGNIENQMKSLRQGIQDVTKKMQKRDQHYVEHEDSSDDLLTNDNIITIDNSENKDEKDNDDNESSHNSKNSGNNSSQTNSNNNDDNVNKRTETPATQNLSPKNDEEIMDQIGPLRSVMSSSVTPRTGDHVISLKASESVSVVSGVPLSPVGDTTDEEGLEGRPSLASSRSSSVRSISLINDKSFRYGIALSRPHFTFLEEAFDPVKKIHDLMQDKDQRLFFTINSNDEELSTSTSGSGGSGSGGSGGSGGSVTGNRNGEDDFDDNELKNLSILARGAQVFSDGSKHESNISSGILAGSAKLLSNQLRIDNEKKGNSQHRLSSKTRRVSSRVGGLLQEQKEKHETKRAIRRKLRAMSEAYKMEEPQTEKEITFAISEGNVKFDWTTFGREYIYNYFHWFVLPLVVYNEKWTGARSRVYWGRNFGNTAALKAGLMNLLIWFCNALFVFTFTPQMRQDYLLEIFSLNLFHAARCCIVAVKWGYQPPAIFEMMRRQFAMIHLLGGWIGILPDCVAREIGQCCARLELDINKLVFKFKVEGETKQEKSREKYAKKQTGKQEQSLKKPMLYTGGMEKDMTDRKTDKKDYKILGETCDLFVCRQGNIYATYGNLLIPYIVFVSSYTTRQATMWSGKVINCFVPICVGLLFIGKIKELGKDYKNTILWEWIFIIVFYGMAYYLLKMLILFCYVIAFDFRRRYYLVRFLTKLLQPGRHAFDKIYSQIANGKLEPKKHLFPSHWQTDQNVINDASLETLELTDATTVYNWSRLRAFILDFGLRFLRREEAILSVFTVEMCLLCIFYFSQVYFNINDRGINVYETLFVFFSAFGVFVPAFISLRAAEQINHKLVEQRSILADKKLRLAHEQYHLEDLVGTSFKSKKAAKQFASNACKSVEMMHQVVRLLEFEKFRIRLLGFEIDTTVTGIFAFVLGSVGFACARLLTAEL